jgi:sulfoxide reductase heme-binding subunit YedZ
VALGVIAMYLVVALIASSLLRKHLGQRTWQAIHWTSYGMWPLAVAHGLTAGTDGTAWWMLGIDLLCLAVVAACIAWRLAPRATMPPLPATARRSSVGG